MLPARATTRPTRLRRSSSGAATNRTAGYNLTYECRLLRGAQRRAHSRGHALGGRASIPALRLSEAVLEPRVGGHIFQARSVDLGGNKDASPAWHTWWIHPPPPDVTPPDTEILSGPDAVTVLTSATFTFTGSDNQTPTESLTYQCRVDGGTWATCTSPHTVNGLAPHPEHSFQVRAVDLSGNLDDVNMAVDNPSAPDPLDPSDGVPAAYVWRGRRAGLEDRLLRPEDHAEHHRQQQPRRLSRARPDRRRGQHHHRPERQDGRRQVDRRRDPQQRLRLSDDQEWAPQGLRLGRHAQHGREVQHHRGRHGPAEQEAGIRLGEQTSPEDATSLRPSRHRLPVERRREHRPVEHARLQHARRLDQQRRQGQRRHREHDRRHERRGGLDRAREQNLIEGNDIAVASKAGVLLEGALDNTSGTTHRGDRNRRHHRRDDPGHGRHRVERQPRRGQPHLRSAAPRSRSRSRARTRWSTTSAS